MIGLTLVNFIVNLHIIQTFKGQAYSDYDTGSETITYKLQSGKEKTIRFGESTFVIVGSRDLTKKERFEILCFVSHCLKEKGIPCTRTIQNMEGELVLHTFLCRLNYKTDSTENADLDYAKDRRWYVNAATTVMQILGL